MREDLIGWAKKITPEEIATQGIMIYCPDAIGLAKPCKDKQYDCIKCWQEALKENEE